MSVGNQGLILLLNEMNGGSASMKVIDTEIPANTPHNVELRQKWKIKCGKALFTLRTYILIS